MNMILLAAATFLAVVSSELNRGIQSFQEDSLRGQDDKNFQIDGLDEKNNSFHTLSEKEFDYVQSSGNNWLDAVPGVPGKDYPNLETIPQTSFSCANKKPGGYYADVETGCQVFHVCNVENVKSSFLCPPGSIFNQKYLVCDWWYDFECENASDLYPLNDSINRGGTSSDSSGPIDDYTVDTNSRLSSKKESSVAYQESNLVNHGADLSLAGTGEGGLGYSGNKSNRPFENYETNVNQGIRFASRLDGNIDLTKQSERPSTSVNQRRNEFFQDRPVHGNPNDDREVQSINKKDRHSGNDFRRENSDSIDNIQGHSVDIFSPGNKQQFADYIPRGFAANYGKTKEVQYLNFNNEDNKKRYHNNQKTEINSTPKSKIDYSQSAETKPVVFDSTSLVTNAVRKESDSGWKNYYVPFERIHKNQNSYNKRDFGDEENSSFDEDKFDRQRQEEVDNTILNKKIVNNENVEDGKFNFEYDSETKELSSEKPPSVESGSSYDSEKYFANVNSRVEKHSDNHKRYSNEKNNQTRFDSNFGGRPISDGFSNGLGNIGSNVNTGITTINLRPQKSESYSHLRGIANSNSKVFANKETADHFDVISNSENSGFSTLSAKTLSRPMSPGRITEIMAIRDVSRTTEDEITFPQNSQIAKEFLKPRFNDNENLRKENAEKYPSSGQFRFLNKNEQNSDYQNGRNQHMPLINFEEESQQKAKGYQHAGV